jgi:hypothetical protein
MIQIIYCSAHHQQQQQQQQQQVSPSISSVSSMAPPSNQHYQLVLFFAAAAKQMMPQKPSPLWNLNPLFASIVLPHSAHLKQPGWNFLVICFTSRKLPSEIG